MLFCSSVSAQITVTQFNAEWNDANKVEWFEKLDDCELAKVCIVAQPKLQDKYKISLKKAGGSQLMSAGKEEAIARKVFR